MSKIKNKTRLTYKYIKQNSMIKGHDDEYQLTVAEYNILHNFFITHSMCKGSSSKRKTFIDYGWSSNKISGNGSLNKLRLILSLNNNKNFIFLHKGNLKSEYERLGLFDKMILDKNTERGVMITTNQKNNYFRFFQRIRNGLAHGNYKLIYSDDSEKMVVIQDNDKYNVTARIVIKLETLLNIIKIIDKNMFYK